MKRTLFILMVLATSLQLSAAAASESNTQKQDFEKPQKANMVRYYVYRQLSLNEFVGPIYYEQASAALAKLDKDAKMKIFTYKRFGSGNEYVKTLYSEVKNDLEKEFAEAAADPMNKQSLDWLLK